MKGLLIDSHIQINVLLNIVLNTGKGISCEALNSSCRVLQLMMGKNHGSSNELTTIPRFVL